MSENEVQVPAEEETKPAETSETAADAQTAEAPAEAAQEAPAEAAAEAPAETAAEAAEPAPAPEPEPEEISYHAVEKEGEITAIWEMQGQKHLRTIDPRSTEGQKIFALFTSDIHETDSPPLSSEASS